MKITRRKVKRTISLEEFKRMKEIAPFEDMRQAGKMLNFGMLFGMSASTFASRSITPKWSDERVEEFIAENDLYDLKFKVAEAHKYADPKEWAYITVADFMRSQFFKTYPGLMERIEDYRKFACENGYVRSFHGAIRRFPHLMLMGKDDDRKEMAGYLNMAVNSTIQNDEACRVMACMAEFMNWRNANRIKSYIYGTVHDSVDFVLYDDELEKVLPVIHTIFEKEEPWQKGIPLTVDLKIADLSRGEQYKGGLKEKAFMKRRKESKKI